MRRLSPLPKPGIRHPDENRRSSTSLTTIFLTRYARPTRPSLASEHRHVPTALRMAAIDEEVWRCARLPKGHVLLYETLSRAGKLRPVQGQRR